MTTHRRFAVPAALCALLAAVAAWGFVVVPADARVPTHWNFQGEVDGWSGKTFGLLFPVGLGVAMTLLLAFLPRLDPRRRHVEQSTKALAMVAAAVDALLLVIAVVTVLVATGRDVDMTRVLAPALGLLFAVIGNYLTKTRSNFFIGIRTPWTLSDDRVWARTHRLGGRLFVALGVVGAVTGLLAPGVGIVVIGAGAIAVAVVTSVYSYVVFRRQTAATTT